MKNEDRSLLVELLETPSVTGSEQAVQRLIHKRFNNIAHRIEPDLMGNLTLVLNPHAPRKVMLASHCDQIGFLINYISADGYIYLDSVGGTDSGVVLGQRLLIHAKAGVVEGVVGRKPVLLQSGPEVQAIPAKHKIWVDIGAANKEEALELVALGDYVSFPPVIVDLQHNMIAGPGLDNKAGLYVCLQVLKNALHSVARWDFMF